jgi:hypothetical protein
MTCSHDVVVLEMLIVVELGVLLPPTIRSTWDLFVFLICISQLCNNLVSMHPLVVCKAMGIILCCSSLSGTCIMAQSLYILDDVLASTLESIS